MQTHKLHAQLVFNRTFWYSLEWEAFDFSETQFLNIFYRKKMNHGFHFGHHQQLFQCMPYRSLNYMFSITVLTLLLLHPLYHPHCLRVVPRQDVGFKISDLYRNFGRIWGQTQEQSDNKRTAIIHVHYTQYLALPSFSDLPRITNLSFHMILPEEKKRFLEAWQKITRSNGKDPNTGLQKLKFWVGALVSWKNFFCFCIWTC